MPIFLKHHCHPQVQEMLAARKTRTREALALMWCAGQLPGKNLAQGLRGLWFLVKHFIVLDN